MRPPTPFTPPVHHLMAVSRGVIYPLIGHGSYDYGRMPDRYFMESAEDVIT